MNVQKVHMLEFLEEDNIIYNHLNRFLNYFKKPINFIYMFKYFTTKNNINLYFLALSSLFANSIIFSIIPSLIDEKINLNNPNVNYDNYVSIIEAFIDSVILAPLIETFIFQLVIFKISKNLIKNKKSSLITFLITSSLCFGFSHFSSPIYIVYTVFSGFIFAFFYEIFHLKKGNPFLLITTIHSIFNFILFLINII